MPFPSSLLLAVELTTRSEPRSASLATEHDRLFVKYSAKVVREYSKLAVKGDDVARHLETCVTKPKLEEKGTTF